MEEAHGIVTVVDEREVRILGTHKGTANSSVEPVWKSRRVFLILAKISWL